MTTTLSRENRELPEEMVLEFLRDAAPAALPYTKRVGQWLWVIFPSKPDVETRGTAKAGGGGAASDWSADLDTRSYHVVLRKRPRSHPV